MSSKGATHKGKHHQTFSQKHNSHKHQRNRLMDDKYAAQVEVGGMTYEELQHHVRKCRSKVAHKSKGAAWQAKLSAEKKYGVEFQVYCCDICGRFHITSHPWDKDGEK